MSIKEQYSVQIEVAYKKKVVFSFSIQETGFADWVALG
jgi:hypothetical protein